MTITCNTCMEPIIEDTKYQEWLSLFNFLEVLLSEDYITQKTYDIMTNRLMTFKTFAYDNERNENIDDKSNNKSDVSLRELIINRIVNICEENETDIELPNNYDNLDDPTLLGLFEMIKYQLVIMDFNKDKEESNV